MKTFRKPHPNKYKAQRTTIAGISFASKAEAKRYSELKLLERAGEICQLELQPEYAFVIEGRPLVYPNGRQARFRADFRYFDVKRNQRVVEDKKSPASRTEAYQLRKLLVEHLWPGTKIEEV